MLEPLPGVAIERRDRRTRFDLTRRDRRRGEQEQEPGDEEPGGPGPGTMTQDFPLPPIACALLMVIYEVETDDLQKTLDALNSGSGNMEMSDALDQQSTVAWAFSPCSDRLEG